MRPRDSDLRYGAAGRFITGPLSFVAELCGKVEAAKDDDVLLIFLPGEATPSMHLMVGVLRAWDSKIDTVEPLVQVPITVSTGFEAHADELITSRQSQERPMSPWWSAEDALNELWRGLDTRTTTNGEVRAYLKTHLESAFEAGKVAVEKEADWQRRSAPTIEPA